MKKISLLTTIFSFAFLALIAVPFIYAIKTAAQSVENLALQKQVTSSSDESSAFSPNNAVDGNTGTRWASQEGVDPQWISVDLGDSHDIGRVRLNWEDAYGKAYQIHISNDGQSWTTIYSTADSDGGVDDVTNLSGSGRYVRIYGTVRGTEWGYSLWEVEVYGSSETQPTSVQPSPTPTAAPTTTPVPTTAPAAVSSTIKMTADNAYQLYVNGALVGSGSEWKTAESYVRNLNSGKNVIAVKATDAGGVAGFLAEIAVNGKRLGTSRDWKVSLSAPSNWTGVGFNDAGWSSATDFGKYSVSPWYTNVSGIPSDTSAHWIWSSNNDLHNTVYLRYTLDTNNLSQPQSPYCAQLPANIIGWWRAEGNANDSISANNGFMQSGAGIGAGKVGQAFLFPHMNMDESIIFPQAPTKFNLSSEVTIEAWINPKSLYPSTGRPGGILSKGTYPHTGKRNYGLQMWPGGGLHLSSVDVKDTDANDLNVVLNTPLGVLSTNKWQHVAATIKWGTGGSMKIYVNGVLKASKNISFRPNTETVPLTIGSEVGKYPFPGSIDEVSVYSRALSAAEVQRIYNAGSAGKCR